MTDWFAGLRFRHKLVMVFLPLIIVPLVILSLVSLRVFTTTIVDKTMRSMRDNSRLIAARVDSIITNAMGCAAMVSIGIDDEIGEVLLAGLGDAVNPAVHGAIDNQMSYALLLFRDVESIAFISNERHAFSSNWEERIDHRALTETAFYRDVCESNGAFLWSPVRTRTVDQDPEVTIPAPRVITVGKKVLAANTGETLGCLFVDISVHTITDMYESLSTSDATQYLILDEAGKRVISYETLGTSLALDTDAAVDWILGTASGATITKVDDEPVLLTSLEYPELGWHLASASPLRSLTRDAQTVRTLSLALLLICLLVSFTSSGLIGRLVTRPILRLQRDMESAESGNLDVRFSGSSRDEVGRLGLGFNAMLSRIGELIETVNRNEKQKREYELALLQEQIKPHFLYNTLDSAAMLLDMERPKEARSAIRALSRFYRSVLSGGREIITIAEELEIVRDYLSIQQLRFPDIFTYTVGVPQEIAQSPIVKLTIQPLVENAIYHGLTPAARRGQLTVSAACTLGVVRITVSDDGIGFPDGWMEQWRRMCCADNRTGEHAADSAESATPHFGLRNVHNRIQLHFGARYGLHIESGAGESTRVMVKLPSGQEMES